MKKIKKITNYYLSSPTILKASLWFLVCSFFQKGISILTTPIFTRIMSIDEFGKFNIFNSWEGIISVIITLNLFLGVYGRGLISYEKERKHFTSSMYGITLCSIILWTIIYLLFQDFFNNLFSLNTQYMIIMILIIWLTAIFNFWASEQRVIYNYKPLVLISLLSSIFQPIFSIIFMNLLPDKTLARILGILISYFIFYFWIFIKQITNTRNLYSHKYWVHALSFGIPLIPHYLSQTVLSGSDRIMIGKMVGESAAGLYGLSYSLSLIMLLFNNALSQTLGPWIYMKIKKKEISKISQLTEPSLIMVAIINLLLISFAPEVIRIFAPEKYYNAVLVIPPVAMSVFFMFCYDLFAKFEFYYKKTFFISLATIIGAIINIITNYIFIGLFGYVAAGYTTLFCYILYAASHYIFMRHVCNKELNKVTPYNARRLFIITIIFLTIGFLELLLYNNTTVRYLSILLFFIIIILHKNKILSYFKEILQFKEGNKK